MPQPQLKVIKEGQVWMVSDYRRNSAARHLVEKMLGLEASDFRKRDGLIMAISDDLGGMLNFVEQSTSKSQRRKDQATFVDLAAYVEHLDWCKSRTMIMLHAPGNRDEIVAIQRQACDCGLAKLLKKLKIKVRTLHLKPKA